MKRTMIVAVLFVAVAMLAIAVSAPVYAERAAVTGAQDQRRGAVSEQAGCDDISLGQFVMAHRERTELKRDQQHIGAGPRLCEPRRNR